MQLKVDLLKSKERTWDLYMILLHASRLKKEKRGRFYRWKLPSPFPSVLSVKLFYYRTSDNVKTETPLEFEPSSPEFIYLSVEVTRYRFLLTLSLSRFFSGETINEERKMWVLIIPAWSVSANPEKTQSL